MTFDQLKDSLPDYAKDVRMNVGGLMNSATLNPQQLWGVMLSCAIATRNAEVMQAVNAEAAQHLSAEYQQAARTAACLMAMNNVYYRTLHLIGKEEYKSMPARLRMTGIGNHGIEKLDFELFSLGVSCIGGCGMCLESHEHEVMEKGATREMVQEVFRIAAIMQSFAVSLECAENTGNTVSAAA